MSAQVGTKERWDLFISEHACKLCRDCRERFALASMPWAWMPEGMQIPGLGSTSTTLGWGEPPYAVPGLCQRPSLVKMSGLPCLKELSGSHQVSTFCLAANFSLFRSCYLFTLCVTSKAGGFVHSAVILKEHCSLWQYLQKHC